MKKIYTSIGAMLLCGAMSAQIHNTAPYKLERSIVDMGNKDHHQIEAIRNNGNANFQNRATYWSEDFDDAVPNGTQGDADFTTSNGVWTNTNNGNITVNWDTTSTGHANDAGSTYFIPALATNTSTRWMVLDSDSDGSAGSPEENILTSPVMDLSSAPVNLAVEWQQFFAEWQSDTLYVEVSIDGGTTWNGISVSDGVGRDNRPNPENVRVNITSYLDPTPANNSNVQVRFRWTGNWDYGWQIDNVEVVDMPDHDLSQAEGGYRNVTANGIFGEKIVYTKVPSDQLDAGGIEFFSTNVNIGASDQTNVELQGEVWDSNPTNIFTGTGTAQTLLAGDTLRDSTNAWTTIPTTPAAYTMVTYSNFANLGSDANTLDNYDTASFEVTADEYARDIGEYTGTGNANGDDGSGNANAFILGTMYEMKTTATLDVIRFALTPASEAGAVLYGYVIEMDPNATDFQDIFINVVYDGSQTPNGEVSVQPWNISQAPNITWVNLPVVNGVQLNAGSTYMVGVGSLGGENAFIMDGQEFFTPDASYYLYDPTDTDPSDGGPWFWVQGGTNIRAVFNVAGQGLSIDEEAAALQTTIAPNPANDFVNINYTLGNTAEVRLQVLDLTGKVVEEVNLGLKPEGSNRHQVNLTDFESGIYYCTITAGEVQRTHKLVVTH